MTKWQLFSSLTRPGCAENRGRLVTIGDKTGYVHAVEREDGSGHRFIVTLYISGGVGELAHKEIVYVETVD